MCSYRRQLRPIRTQRSRSIRFRRVRRKIELDEQCQSKNTLVRVRHPRTRHEHKYGTTTLPFRK